LVFVLAFAFFDSTKFVAMENLNNIKTWSLQDQPVHKLFSKGAKYLSDVELLAILLQHGTVH
jgi:hypothetical protein